MALEAQQARVCTVEYAPDDQRFICRGQSCTVFNLCSEGGLSALGTIAALNAQIAQASDAAITDTDGKTYAHVICTFTPPPLPEGARLRRKGFVLVRTSEPTPPAPPET